MGMLVKGRRITEDDDQLVTRQVDLIKMVG
jgi:hypothetical protein